MLNSFSSVESNQCFTVTGSFGGVSLSGSGMTLAPSSGSGSVKVFGAACVSSGTVKRKYSLHSGLVRKSYAGSCTGAAVFTGYFIPLYLTGHVSDAQRLKLTFLSRAAKRWSCATVCTSLLFNIYIN